MNKETYKQKFSKEDAVGWLAIDDALANVYNDNQPRHYPPLCGLHYAAGGTDPLDGISIYDSTSQQPHYHFISYGMSELYYNEESAGDQFSKWGFEFTLRLAPFKEDSGDPVWVMHLMNNLARYVESSGRWFEENNFLPANGPIRINTETAITGLILVPDPELGKIDTPNGEVTFLQLVGITDNELNELLQNTSSEVVNKLAMELKINNPLLITDLTRQ